MMTKQNNTAALIACPANLGLGLGSRLGSEVGKRTMCAQCGLCSGSTGTADRRANTDEQLEGVAGGAAYIKFPAGRGVLSDDLTGFTKQGGRFSFDEIKIIDPIYNGR